MRFHFSQWKTFEFRHSSSLKFCRRRVEDATLGKKYCVIPAQEKATLSLCKPILFDISLYTLTLLMTMRGS